MLMRGDKSSRKGDLPGEIYEIYITLRNLRKHKSERQNAWRGNAKTHATVPEDASACITIRSRANREISIL